MLASVPVRERQRFVIVFFFGCRTKNCHFYYSLYFAILMYCAFAILSNVFLNLDGYTLFKLSQILILVRSFESVSVSVSLVEQYL